MTKKAEKATKAPAKTTKAKAAAPAPKKGRTPKAPLDIAFGTWLKSARARADKNVAGVPELMIELKGDKKIKEDAKLTNVAKRFDGNAAFAVIASRYEGFTKRGPQSKKAA